MFKDRGWLQQLKQVLEVLNLLYNCKVLCIYAIAKIRSTRYRYRFATVFLCDIDFTKKFRRQAHLCDNFQCDNFQCDNCFNDRHVSTTSMIVRKNFQLQARLCKKFSNDKHDCTTIFSATRFLCDKRERGATPRTTVNQTG